MTRNIKVLPPHKISVEPKPKKTYPAPTLRHATKLDIHELARIEVEALSSNLLLRLYFPDPNAFYRHLVAFLEQLFEEPEFQVYIVKAVSDEGELMGWGAWTLRPADLDLRETGTKPCNSWIVVKANELSSSGRKEGRGIFPSVPGLPEYVQDSARVALEGWILGRRHLLLNGLFTNPKYQNQGVAAAILNWGDEKADLQGLPCFVQSTPSAHGLYRKDGWKDVGSLDVDLRDWVAGGGDGMGWGTYRISYLIRLPVNKRDEERKRLVMKLKSAGSMKDPRDMVRGVDYM